MAVLWEEPMPYLVAAARAYRAGVLAAAPDAEPDTAAAVGRSLLWELFRTQAAGGQLPTVLAAMVASPDDAEALDALGDEVAGALAGDPQVTATVVELLTRFYQRRIAAGSTKALVRLGELRHALDDDEGAQAAYQQAAERGDARAMLSLADLLMDELGDPDGARVWFERAADAADAGVAAQAMVDLGHLLVIFQRDYPAAQAWFQRAIESAHPEWAPAGLVGLGDLLVKQGDAGGAQARYQRAADSGHPDWAAQASVRLGKLLRQEGDGAGARAVLLRVIQSGSADWAPPALIELLNLLREEDDLDGARAAYRLAVETGNPDASYGLLVVGQLLKQRGDSDGARAVFQQGADAGDEGAQHELDLITQPSEPEPDAGWADDELVDLPPELNPRNMRTTGVAVLEHGLPALPETLTYPMAVPIAYWTTERCAVVLFLIYSRHGTEEPYPVAMMGSFTLEDGQWVPVPGPWLGTSFSIDPIARPDDLRDLPGQPIVSNGGSSSDQPEPGHLARIVHGRAGPAVAQLAVLQDGHEARRPLESHFGAWVVCTEHVSPFQVHALDADGTVLASLDEP